MRFRSLIAELSGEHIVSDVEAAATSIAIIHKGHLVTHALPEEILQSVEGKVWAWYISSQELPGPNLLYALIFAASVLIAVRPAGSPTGGLPEWLDPAVMTIVVNPRCHTCSWSLFWRSIVILDEAIMTFFYAPIRRKIITVNSQLRF